MANVEEFTKSERNDKVITFLGRIHHAKVHEYFVEVATRVLQHQRRAFCYGLGSGDMMVTIRLVAQKGIADKFHFTGFLKGRQVYENACRK